MIAILKKIPPMIFSCPKLGQFLSFFKNLKTGEQFINYIGLPGAMRILLRMRMHHMPQHRSATPRAFTNYWKYILGPKVKGM